MGEPKTLPSDTTVGAFRAESPHTSFGCRSRTKRSTGRSLTSTKGGTRTAKCATVWKFTLKGGDPLGVPITCPSTTRESYATDTPFPVSLKHTGDRDQPA